MAIACLVMFFIGAPFGAIVRKGGLGLPVVIGVLLFLIYYVIATTMEKICKKGDFNPVLGMWFAPIILSPLGIFLTYKAATDSALFRWEAYKKWFKTLFKKN
jgi:lipopolysaccharide export system permease protein